MRVNCAVAFVLFALYSWGAAEPTLQDELARLSMRMNTPITLELEGILSPDLRCDPEAAPTATAEDRLTTLADLGGLAWKYKQIEDGHRLIVLHDKKGSGSTTKSAEPGLVWTDETIRPHEDALFLKQWTDLTCQLHEMNQSSADTRNTIEYTQQYIDVRLRKKQLLESSTWRRAVMPPIDETPPPAPMAWIHYEYHRKKQEQATEADLQEKQIAWEKAFRAAQSKDRDRRLARAQTDLTEVRSQLTKIQADLEEAKRAAARLRTRSLISQTTKG